ncbi:MAG: ATP phosphoribosyltransferase regulatory subunit, partial [Candidatus Saganbacteria bacterium]|nr:ATP phosphoribosyltransferase regulatory subunit [Candidatus Saganbacteria bacterium]
NPLRVLDCKEEGCKKELAGIPALKEMLCKECSSHFDNIVKALEKQKIKVKINDRLVRGLDYYTRTTFEIISGELGSQNAVAGGGRYDDLVKELGGPSVPAVGFAIGLERLISVMTAQNILPKDSKPDSIYIAWIGEEAKDKAFETAVKIRGRGITVNITYDAKSLSSQLKAADSLGAKYVLMLGEDELKRGVFTVRNMMTNQQEEMKEERALELL